jgi:hypothetical protein
MVLGFNKTRQRCRKKSLLRVWPRLQGDASIPHLSAITATSTAAITSSVVAVATASIPISIATITPAITASTCLLSLLLSH